LDHIVERLLEHGAADARPAAIVAQGTTSEQRVIAATLATIRGLAAGAKLQPPALLIVGEVAALHASLAWFNTFSAADLSQTA
jgi:uroporphyrin-III C-methyltransferase / precorrin-2 dehydrogenase / sirohydrochlorin ferrochelatase